MSFRRSDAERAIQDFLLALGLDPHAPELRDTPRRVAHAFINELLSGYQVDVRELLQIGSEPTAGQSNIVVVAGITLATVCPHHLMPAVGTATVAYAPGARILGLGTIAGLVHAFARRLTLQEKIGTSVVDALLEFGARGAFCRLVLRHTCLSARGAEQHAASVVTTASAGEFTSPQGLAALTLALAEEHEPQ